MGPTVKSGMLTEMVAYMPRLLFTPPSHSHLAVLPSTLEGIRKEVDGGTSKRAHMRMAIHAAGTIRALA